jgi:hypothetical protein
MTSLCGGRQQWKVLESRLYQRSGQSHYKQMLLRQIAEATQCGDPSMQFDTVINPLAYV